MTDEEIKRVIENTAAEMGGCKATELVVVLARKLVTKTDISDRLLDLLGECIDEGRIIEIEYTLPTMPRRAKSFYLPKGAVLLSHERA